MPMYQMTQYRLSSAYERVGSTGRPRSFCSAPTYPAVPAPGFQCAVCTEGRIRKAISTAATSPAATSGTCHRSAPRATRLTRARAGGQAVTATAATVATATASAIRLACRTAKPGADSAAGATTALTTTPYPAPASTPSPSGSACGRRAATSTPMKGMTGIRSGSTLSEASRSRITTDMRALIVPHSPCTAAA